VQVQVGVEAKVEAKVGVEAGVEVPVEVPPTVRITVIMIINPLPIHLIITLEIVMENTTTVLLIAQEIPKEIPCQPHPRHHVPKIIGGLDGIIKRIAGAQVPLGGIKVGVKARAHLG